MRNSPSLSVSNIPWGSCLLYEDEKLYHRRSGEYMSSHQLKEFRRCPAFFFRQRMGLAPREDKSSFLVGRAAHCLIIEGRAEYDRRYMTGGPVNPKTGKHYGAETKAHAEWAAQQDRWVLSPDQAAQVERMAEAVSAHDVASRWFAGCVAEGVVRRTFCGVPCQIRIDCLHPNYGLVDLKTTADIDWFESDARKFGYLHQLAFYRDILADAAGMKPVDIPCRIVAVEKAEPFRCGAWLAAPATLDDCSLQNTAALEEFSRCDASGVWPTRYEEERVFHGD